MLNRTNRTLSANLNRLNLGTRSFASLANFNIGAQTLRTRHAHPQVVGVQVRAGGQTAFGCSLPKEKSKPWSLGSSLLLLESPMASEQMSRPSLVAEAPPVWTDLVDWPVVTIRQPRAIRTAESLPSATERCLADMAYYRAASGG